MPEPIVRIHLPLEFSGGRLLDSNGDEVRHPLAFPKFISNTTVILAVELFDRELQPDLSWRLEPHPLDAGDTWSISGACSRSADPVPMFTHDPAGVNLPGDWPDGTDADPTAGRLTFRLRTDTQRFREIAAHPVLSRHCSICIVSGSATLLLTEIPFVPVNRPGNESPPDDDESAGSRTTLNGLSGAVILADAQGKPLPSEGQTITIPAGGGSFAGLLPIADPVTEMAVADETWGDCRYLDAAFRQLSFRGRVRSLRRVSLETVSIDSGVTGNIVLVPIVNGSELSGTSFVVAVGAAPAVAEFALEVVSGTLALRRDTDDERDTLKDSGNTPVTAVVLSVILEVQYDA